MFQSFAEIIAAARLHEKIKIAVAAAADADVLEAVAAAKRSGIADAVLVGDTVEIKELCRKENIDWDLFELEQASDVREWRTKTGRRAGSQWLCASTDERVGRNSGFYAGGVE